MIHEILFANGRLREFEGKLRPLQQKLEKSMRERRTSKKR